MAGTDETLRWERENRTRAGLAAIAAAVLTLAGNLITQASAGGAPKPQGDRVITVTDALRDTVAGRPIPPGGFSERTVYLGQHVAGPIIGAVLAAVGTLLLFLPLAFLFRAVRARRPELGQRGLVLLAVGAVLFAVGGLVVQAAYDLHAHDYVDAARKSNALANDTVTSSPFVEGQLLALAGGLALGSGIVITALNAMRLGLLTRFMGILGMIVGASIALAFLFPLDQLGIIRSFWLGAVGVLLLGRMPSGTPRAWETGEAVPWPTQQQVREARDAARTRRGEPAPAGAAAAADPPPRGGPAPRTPAPTRPVPRTDEPHSASKKKRRKRRG